ncbi:hypothetical protein CBS147325_6235 [Penicillium roqueforti]|nr:hypothetical protein CBS147326_9254 [Penicillium roqueforti]KAI3140944.1 hypothetical protein CBS147325_6235 [Penicillium roqueforti]KAI3187223.1 hypothetical protein DTO032C6_4001 [Penicillium roqueforti]KAI3251643.1 hypothetical protein DTO006G7_7521 [Penicillium roqueforti]KAI3274263.1 hypothetical protein CBS147309_4167 [Penicillium roqueforti]
MEVITETIMITTTFLRVTSVVPSPTAPSAIDNLARIPNGLWVVISIVVSGLLAMGFSVLKQKGDAKAREAKEAEEATPGPRDAWARDPQKARNAWLGSLTKEPLVHGQSCYKAERSRRHEQLIGQCWAHHCPWFEAARRGPRMRGYGTDGVPLLFCPISSLREPQRGEMNENGCTIKGAFAAFLWGFLTVFASLREPQ